MITHITHAGVLHVDDVVDTNNGRNLLISILDNTTPYSRPDFSKFHDSLALTFKDRCEEDFGLYDHWPDEPTASDNFSVLRVVDERLFSYTDAVKIVEFVEKWMRSPDEFHLIAHCKSGVGRSAAIAEFFGIVHNIPYKGTDPRGRFIPNCRVTRLLTKAYYNKYKHENSGIKPAQLHELDLSNRCYLTS